MTQTESARILCDIYRSKDKPDMYLYVSQTEGLEGVPEALMQQFGKVEKAMTLMLTPDRKLARADINQVMQNLRDKGYYLQIPPRPEAYMQSVNQHNDKLSGA